MVYFHSEDIDFSIHSSISVASWIKQVVSNENQTLGELNIIFCSDPYLLRINQEYLNHDYFTDIITFDNSDSHSIEGDLFISIERVKENAINANVDFIDELHRVIIHGILHLLGYTDKEDKEIELMRQLENFYLNSRKF